MVPVRAQYCTPAMRKPEISCLAREEVYGLEACSAKVPQCGTCAAWLGVANISLMTGPPVLYKTDCIIE